MGLASAAYIRTHTKQNGLLREVVLVLTGAPQGHGQTQTPSNLSSPILPACPLLLTRRAVLCHILMTKNGDMGRAQAPASLVSPSRPENSSFSRSPDHKSPTYVCSELCPTATLRQFGRLLAWSWHGPFAAPPQPWEFYQ